MNKLLIGLLLLLITGCDQPKDLWLYTHTHAQKALVAFIIGNNPQVPLEYAERLSETLIKEGGYAGIDPALIASVAALESHFWPGSVSPKGAIGVMQVMPMWAGVMVSCPSSSKLLYDPQTNVRCGVEVLSLVIKKHKGDLEKALAEYNTGPGKLELGKGYVRQVIELRTNLCQVEQSLCSIKKE